MEEIVALRRVAGQSGAAPRPSTARPQPPLRAWADRDDVRQIVAGLIRNAVTYTPAAGSIAVRIARGDGPGTVVLEVADTGPGIPPEELPRAFDFGFRGELALQLRAPGLGAGLWICRELAGRNGGRVELASEPGAGVTASLTLPAAGEPQG